jgi:hypothetical protein
MIDTDKYEETDHPELVEFEGETLGDTLTNLLTEVKRLRQIIQVQIVTPRSKQFFMQHYGKDDFEERWKEWTDGIQDRFWGRKND